ncbi:hypothetical protein GCQ56_12340 [Marinifilum sp. N1E240]|uniref:hypothetical protein n=1 Tax=Marinifilum sp. N1E240 TaxID=2608082 RepID=UPI00128D7D44|nr:hypothetical protein [Marinifilum sp. N1E240]MPQ47791.1 hypothetical protein [Marinifilum sp. N1E240]
MKNLYTFILFLTMSFNLLGQNSTKDFSITVPENKVSNSLYSKIELLDCRIDTSHLGVVQVGMLNRKAKVIPEVSLSSQLNDIMSEIIDSSALNGELLFQIRKLSFAEITKATSEKGYFYLRAVLYSKQGERYHKLSDIDTLSIVKGMDVTKKIFRTGSKVMTDFISQNLNKEVKDLESYSYHEIVKLDSCEKRKLKLYNTKNYKDGLYYTFGSFRDQEPDNEVFVKRRKDLSIASVKVHDEFNQLVKVKSKNIYAIVEDGQAYIATKYGYYNLCKSDDYFYFVGDVEATANSADVVAAGAFFGVLGGLLASGARGTKYFIVIDHINGGFILYKEIG